MAMRGVVWNNEKTISSGKVNTAVVNPAFTFIRVPHADFEALRAEWETGKDANKVSCDST
mgnify:CR=1 FL=1